MGSCLSSIISNLFVNMLENSVVAKFEKSGDIISWVRYADDCCIIIKKGSFNNIFKKIYGWDKNLFFTSEKMTNNSLVFLDCELLIDNRKIEF